MSHREVLQALSGLFMGMFVSLIASTVVSTSLPRILSDLGGGQSAYTWVVTATILTMTVSTPLWGKFADLFNRKLLLQLSLTIFIVGSALAGLSQNPGTLIAFRAMQGIGAGGLGALTQIIMADIVSPRERGRYMGVLGAVTSVGMVAGPLLGGLITDSIGWRWNFYVGVPIAIVALLLIQKTLHLPVRPRRAVSIDYLGAMLLAAGVSLLLVWISLAGAQFAWGSAQSLIMVVTSVVLLAAFVFAERRAREPIIPLELFRNRTVVMAIFASLGVGVVMIGASVFLSQYFQLSRGHSPSETGLLTIPMVAGSLIASVFGGQYISRSGKWKPVMVIGSIGMTLGILGLGTIRVDTNMILVGVFMLMTGLGMGAVLQNLVLVVQNVVPVRQMGAASSSVTFFRSLGGTVGVSVMGAVLGSRVVTLIDDGLGDLSAGADNFDAGRIPDLAALPEPIRLVVEGAYGVAVGNVFLLVVPLAILTIIAVAMLPNRPLGTRTAAEQMDDEVSAPVPTVPKAAAQAGIPDRRYAGSREPRVARQS